MKEQLRRPEGWFHPAVWARCVEMARNTPRHHGPFRWPEEKSRLGRHLGVVYVIWAVRGADVICAYVGQTAKTPLERIGTHMGSSPLGNRIGHMRAEGYALFVTYYVVHGGRKQWLSRVPGRYLDRSENLLLAAERRSILRLRPIFNRDDIARSARARAGA